MLLRQDNNRHIIVGLMMLCIKSGICQALPRLRRPLICGGKTDSIYQIPQVLKIVVLPLPSCPELSVVLFQ